MPISRSALTAALAAASLLATGCQPAMSNQPRETSQMGVGHEYPLRFTNHAFSGFCFETLACEIAYAGRTIRHPEPMPAPVRADYQRGWGLGTHVGIDNFPAPAKVRWTAPDGSSHEAEVDLGEIFRDQRVLHQVDKADLPTDTVAHSDGPGIFLEVRDRTINVYMRQLVFLKDTTDRKGQSRSDVIKAWSKTY